MAAAPTLSTDLPDYPPGSVVIITGAGFAADEVVTLQVLMVGDLGDNLTSPAHAPWTVNAGADGSLAATWQVPLDGDELGASLHLSANGATGTKADAYFTDGPPPAANLDQGVNGGVTKPPLVPVDWVNGNANAQNSHFIEGQSIPYRMILTRLSIGSHVVEIEWDIRHSGRNAIDYITSFQRISETVNPLLGTEVSGLPSLFNIPSPPVFTTAGTVGGLSQPTSSYLLVQAAGQEKFAIYNGTVSDLQYVPNAQGNLGDLTASISSTRLRITFNATSPTVVFAWGGHIGSRLDWGDGNSAGGVSGSPYHTRLISLDGSGGNQDRSLSVDAVCIPPIVTISGPAVLCEGGSDTYVASVSGQVKVYHLGSG